MTQVPIFWQPCSESSPAVSTSASLVKNEMNTACSVQGQAGGFSVLLSWAAHVGEDVLDLRNLKRAECSV